MRYLADENVPGLVVKVLRERGYDLDWIGEVMPGALDPDVLASAQLSGRVLLTFDKDFGALAFRSGQKAAAGVVLFRLTAASPSALAALVIDALGSRSDWAGHFSVVESDRLRMRRLGDAIAG